MSILPYQASPSGFLHSDTLVDGRWRMDADLRPAQRGLSILFDGALEHLTPAT